MQKEIICRSLEELPSIAKMLLHLFPEEKIFAFSGELGSGKTTLIKAICNELGVTEITNSPSFAIINEYKSESSGMIYHFDLFRLKNSEELYDIGYEEYFFSGCYCFIEWPEIAQDLLPTEYVHVKIYFCSEDHSRIIILNKKQ